MGDRYASAWVPYNLSSVSPLASTTAALHLLPVLQPLQPSAGGKLAAGEPASAATPAASSTLDLAAVASLLQAAQDETGGCLEDDHCPSVTEQLDWNSAALLTELKGVRPGLFAPPPVTETAALSVLGGEEAGAPALASSLRQPASSPREGRQLNPPSAAVVAPSFSGSSPPSDRVSAAVVSCDPPRSVLKRTNVRAVPVEVSLNDSAKLKRALEAFTELPADTLSSWHVAELRRAVLSDAGSRTLPTVPEPLILDVSRRLQLRIVASMVPLNTTSPLTAACTQAAVDAMECALILVTFMMTPGSVAVLRIEETCEATIDLLRLVLRRVVFPARDPSFEPLAPVNHKRSYKPSTGGGSNTGSEGDTDEEDAAAQSDGDVLWDTRLSPRRARGCRRRRASRSDARIPPPDALLSLCCRVVRVWGEALEAHDGPEEFGGTQASRLALVLLRCLSVSGVTELQLCACSTICVVFRYYEASRHDLLTELLHKVNRLPMGRSDLRRFRVGPPGVQPPMVRVSSALFVQLVHILGGLTEEELRPVAGIPGTRPSRVQQGGAHSQDAVPHVTHLQAVIRMQAAVRVFVDALVAPAFTARDAAARDAKFRDVKGRDGDVDAVTVFVEDVLVLYGLPEWPGADTVVQLLFLSLSKFQQQSTAAKGGPARGVDAFTRASVFAWFGALAARLQAEAVADAEWCAAVPAVTDDRGAAGACGATHGPTEDRNVLCRAAVLAACRPPARGGLHLRCSALFWQTQWVVDDSRTAMKHATKKDTCASSPALPTGVRGPGEPETSPTAAGTVQFVALDCASAGSTVGSVSAAAASRWLTHRRAVVVRLLDRVLDAIMAGFSESVPTVRTQALKAMGLVASVDPLSVQARADFVIAIRSCCMDVSVLVRDAALSLLCNVFSTVDSLDAVVGTSGSTYRFRQDVSTSVVRRFDATFVSNVLPVVSGRLLDTATSVRKRAVGILSQVVADAFLILLSVRRSTAVFENDNRLGDTERLVVDVCALLVTRLADAEDSVRFASQFALRAVLFGHASEKGPRGFRAAGRRDGPFAALLAPSDLVVERTRASILVGTVAKAPVSTGIRSLVEVVDESLLAAERPALLRLLSLVVAELLGADLGATESSPERARARAVVLQRVDACAGAQQSSANVAAVDSETAANDSVSTAVGSLALSPDLECAAQRRIACSRIVSALAMVDANLVFPYCSLLAPLLKGLDGVPQYQVMIASHVLDAIERVIPVVRPVPSELVGELEEDLSLVICTHRDEQLAAAAIKCLCAISPVGCAADRGVHARRSSSTNGEVVGSAPSGSSPAAAVSATADAVGSVRCTKRVRFRPASPVEAVPETLARQFYQYLLDNQSAVKDGSPSFYMNAGVALVRLGLFCRYGTFETATTTAYYKVLQGFASTSSLDWTERHPLREAALEGLAHVVIRRRDLLLSAVPFFAASLRQPGLEGGQADARAQLRVLDDLHDMLLSEDFRAQPSRAAVGDRSHQDGNTGTTLPSATAAADDALSMEDDPDAGSLTAAVQSLQLDLINLAVNADARIRHRVAAILDLTVRHGVLLASALVAPLIGLIADRATMQTSVAALRALEFISSRHSYLLTSRFVDGVLAAFFVASESAGSPMVSPLADTASINSPIGKPPAGCPLALAVDPLTGCSRLSSAVALVAVPRRKVVLESLLKAIHGRSKEAEPGASVTRRALSAGGVRVSTCRRSFPELAFIASTICSIDFGCVSSAGPPSTEKSAGGGTGSSAADAKAKNGRDEIAFIVTTAGRLVSSTGHSLFSAATVALKAASCDVADLQSLAVRSVPLCYLLLVKRHFVEGLRGGGLARGPDALPVAECLSSEAQQFESPLYKMDAALLSANADEATWRQQLRVFCHLMDTDEAIEATAGRSPVGARGRRSRRAT